MGEGLINDGSGEETGGGATTGIGGGAAIFSGTLFVLLHVFGVG